jgi:putative ATP-dependent endonuclease of the OLD family
MILQSLRVQNYRSIRDATLYFDNLTILVGANGAGKSAFLNAIRLFQDPSLPIGREDFYDRNTGRPIDLTGTFGLLDDDEKTQFAPYLDGDDLIIQRLFSWVGDKINTESHGTRRSNAEFDCIEQANGGATGKKAAYNELRTKPEYSEMPSVTKADDIDEHLSEWILKHPEKCSYRADNGEFFGWKGVGNGYLKDHWRVLYIPAIQNAAQDAQDGRSSPLTQLVDMSARKALAGSSDFSEFGEQMKRGFSDLVSRHASDLGALAVDVTGYLDKLVPGSSLKLEWDMSQPMEIKPPTALAFLVEDGYKAPVTHVGDGLQRACVISLMEQLAAGNGPRKIADGSSPLVAGVASLPSYMIVMEEPELYQHPDRQRYLAEVFSRLAGAGIPGVSNDTQVCYSTHSPLCVRMGEFSSVRLVRRVPGQNSSAPKQTSIVQSSVASVLLKLGPAYACSEKELRSKLETLMNPWMNEGFFAGLVVLVEGEDDRAAILTTAKRLEVDLEGQGVAVIPCNGKNNLARPWAVFQDLGIPTYVIWDADAHLGPTGGECPACHRALDKKADPRINQHLLKLVQGDAADWPPTTIGDRYGCFENDLETTLDEELTSGVLQGCLSEAMNELGITKKGHAIKNPLVISQILTLAAAQNHVSQTLDDMVRQIKRLL